jgi:hypothetical protein
VDSASVTRSSESLSVTPRRDEGGIEIDAAIFKAEGRGAISLLLCFAWSGPCGYFTGMPTAFLTLSIQIFPTRLSMTGQHSLARSLAAASFSGYCVRSTTVKP